MYTSQKYNDKICIRPGQEDSICVLIWNKAEAYYVWLKNIHSKIQIQVRYTDGGDWNMRDAIPLVG